MDVTTSRFSGSSGIAGLNEWRQTQLNCSIPISPPYSISDVSACPTPEPSPVSSPVTSKSTISIKWLSQQTSIILEDNSIKDFTNRSQHFFKVFELSASRIKPISSLCLGEVLRLSIWWFTLGNMKLEQLIREGSSFPFAKEDNNILLQQGFVEIAKALWILQSAGPVREVYPSAEEKLPLALLSARLTTLSRIRQGIWALRRHGFLAHLASEHNLLPSSDIPIWIDYPSVGLDIDVLLASSASPTKRAYDLAALSDAFLLGDTEDIFHYSSIAVDVFLFNEGSNSQQIKYPCLMSIVRGLDQRNITIIVSSQNGLLDFSITPGSTRKPNWKDVTWLFFINSLEVKLATGFRLQLRFSSWDFRTIKRMYDHCCLTLDTFQPVEGEEIVCFETMVKSTDYQDSRQSQSQHFPIGSTAGCALRLFEKSVVQPAATGPKTIHAGYRLVLMTPPTCKKLSIMVHETVPERAIQFEILKGEDDDPALSLKIYDNDPKAALVLVFSEPENRNKLLAHITGSYIKDDEAVLAQACLSSFTWTTDLRPSSPIPTPDPLHWHTVLVISRKPSNPDKLLSSKANSPYPESFRIVLDSSKGRITDRLNIGIGELLIRRNVIASGHELKIWRQPQEDLTVSLSDLPVPSDIPEQMSKTLKLMQELPSVRTYRFPNLTDLLNFQAAVTGFKVLFDGTPSSFTISRRRMMVPINKEWSSPHTRIQILQRGRQIQLAAFFEGFSKGECMNFALKGTDVFEKSTKNGTTIVKIVDAKFALPGGGKRVDRDERGFVCLDLLEYPAEHNDICVGFASENEYERFARALPAPVKGR